MDIKTKKEWTKTDVITFTREDIIESLRHTHFKTTDTLVRTDWISTGVILTFESRYPNRTSQNQ